MKDLFEVNKSVGNRNDTINLKIEESKHLSMTASEANFNLVLLDNIFLPNGDAYVVTKVYDDGSVDLMKKGRITIQKKDLPEFFKNAIIDRADCFS